MYKKKIQTTVLAVFAVGVVGISFGFVAKPVHAATIGENFSEGVTGFLQNVHDWLFGEPKVLPQLPSNSTQTTIETIQNTPLSKEVLTPIVQDILNNYRFAHIETTKYLTTRIVTEPTYTTQNITNNTTNNTTATNTVGFDLSGVTKNGLLYVDGNNSLQAVSPGTSGYVLTSNGSGLPSWVSPGAVAVDWPNPGNIGSTTPNSATFTDISVAFSGDTGSTFGHGAFNLDNTNNLGNGFTLSTNAGSSANGDLMNLSVLNRSFQNAAFHTSYYGNKNAFEIVSNSIASASNALAVTSNDINDSTVGIIGNELGRGTIKVSHYRPTGLNDNNASGLSIDLRGVGTAAQGVYVDSTETGGTTGNLLRLRNQTIDRFVVSSVGSLSIGGYGTDTTITKFGNTTNDQFFVGTTGAFRVQRAGAASEAFRTQVAGDSQGRWLGTADGQLKWGSGSAIQDVVLKRSTVGILTLDGSMTFNNSNGAYDTVIKGAGDSNLLHVDATNDKIGIGTSAPIGAVQITRNGAGNANLIVNQTGAYDIFTASASGATKYTIDNAGNQISAVGSGWRPISDSTSALQVQNAAGTPFLYFDTTNGRLGLGTSTPANALQITNGSMTVGTVSTDQFFVGSNGAFRAQRSTANSEAFRLQINGDANGRFLGTSDGRLKWGDGTNTQDVTLRRNNPSQLIIDGGLVINNAASTIDILTASSSGTTKFTVDNLGNIISPAGAGWKPMTDSTGALQIQSSNGTPFVYYDTTNSRVGIGITAPASKLTVAGGDILMDNNQAIKMKDSTAVARNILAYSSSNNLQLYNTAATGIVQIGINNASNTNNIRFFTGANTEKVRIDNAGLAIGATSFGSGATNVLAIANGTIPSSSITGGIQLYAESVASSSELRVRDEAGNVTTLSPHNFSAIPVGSSDPMAWAFYSQRGDLALNVDMLKTVRQVEELSGKQLVYIKNLKTGEYEAETPNGAPAVSNEELANDLVHKTEINQYVTWNDQVWRFLSEVVFQMQVTFQKDATFLAGVSFKGPISVNQDTAGMVVVPAGATKVKVTFTRAFASKPIVYLSPVQTVAGGFSLAEVTENQFVIVLNQAQMNPVEVNWLAILQASNSSTKSEVLESRELSPNASPSVTPMVTPLPSPTPTPTPLVEDVQTASTSGTVATASAGLSP